MNKKLASILAIALCLSSCGSTGTDTTSQAETTTTTTTAETTTTTIAATTTAETTTTTSATTITAPETTTIAETTTSHKTFDLPDISNLDPVDNGLLGSDVHVVTVDKPTTVDTYNAVSAYELFCKDGEILAFINYSTSSTTLVVPLKSGGYDVEVHQYQQGEENNYSIIGYGELVSEYTVFPSDKPVSELKTTMPTTTTTSRPIDTMPQLSTGQSNALKAAKNYIKLMAFSYSGLISQLEYEGYSHDDAVYAADNCDADWYAMAAKAANNYIDIMAFSRDELINQLQYDGYTYDQAVYGAESVGY